MDLFVILVLLLNQRQISSESSSETSSECSSETSSNSSSKSSLDEYQLFKQAFEVHDEYIVKSVEEKRLQVAAKTKLALLNIFKNNSKFRESINSTNNDDVPPPHLDIAFDDDPSSHLDIAFEDLQTQLEKALSVKRNDWFSIFEADHKEGVMELKNYLNEATSPEELVTMCNGIGKNLNEHLFVTALENVLLCKNYDIDLPPVLERFPADFIERSYIDALCDRDKKDHDKKGLSKRRKSRQINGGTVDVQRLANGNYRITRVADLSGRDRFPENRVSYFREDYGMNSHHYNWHRVNLGDTPRRDDYFIYMHLQMLARYNAERFSNNLIRVESYNNLRRPIEVGHVANLGHDNRLFGDRPHNTIPANYVDVGTLEVFKGQLKNGISQRLVNDNGFFDVLERYHDRGHTLISEAVEDEEGRGARNVMIDSPASARDNVFYRWHLHIHELFEQYEAMKRRQTNSYLTYDDLIVPHFQVWDMSLTSHHGTQRMNELVTGCSYHTMEATNGLDFSGRERAYIHMTHLDHVPFTYHILINNRVQRERRGVVRLFLAPTNNELGNKMDLKDQRHFWIELDKYLYTFRPGVNYLRRRSTSSSVSVNCRDTFEDIAERVQSDRDLLNSGHCGCGWPQHLLIPKGNESGMAFTLFIIVTDEHHIQPRSWRLGRSTYCGIPNVNLPDRKPMGYPFHAPAPGNSENIEKFASTLPNVFTREVRIRFTGFQTDENERSIPSCRHARRG